MRFNLFFQNKFRGEGETLPHSRCPFQFHFNFNFPDQSLSSSRKKTRRNKYTCKMNICIYSVVHGSGRSPIPHFDILQIERSRKIHVRFGSYFGSLGFRCTIGRWRLRCRRRIGRRNIQAFGSRRDLKVYLCFFEARLNGKIYVVDLFFVIRFLPC